MILALLEPITGLVLLVFAMARAVRKFLPDLRLGIGMASMARASVVASAGSALGERIPSDTAAGDPVARFIVLSGLWKWLLASGPFSFSHFTERLRSNLRIKNPHRVAKWIAMLFMTIVFARNAWVGDDAFIMMRVADNFVNGYGLVWNAGERVQAFTSPLWMLLLSLAYAGLRDPYWVMYGLSFAISLVGLGLILKYFSNSYRATLLLTLILASSAAFVDYSFSGLENPLTHLLLIGVMIVVFRLDFAPIKLVFVVSLLACLAAFTRLDTLLFYVPLLGWLLYRERAQWFKCIGAMALAFIPLVLWFGFATFYFGFPLPNTYYAKLPSNYEAFYFWEKGIAY